MKIGIRHGYDALPSWWLAADRELVVDSKPIPTYI
jgi:hypothetical protein